MPYSHPSALALRDPPPVTVAFAAPLPTCSHTHSLPVAGAVSRAQNRTLGGARSATLGHSRPLQAALWGVPGQLAAGRPRFNARESAHSHTFIADASSSAVGSISYCAPVLFAFAAALNNVAFGYAVGAISGSLTDRATRTIIWDMRYVGCGRRHR